MKMFNTISYCITALVAAWLFSMSGRFQLIESSSVPFVINRTTGEVWKFYISQGEPGKPAQMGFQRVALP